jgi:ABC-type multidrug transport system fused ATPase/permease subunit
MTPSPPGARRETLALLRPYRGGLIALFALVAAAALAEAGGLVLLSALLGALLAGSGGSPTATLRPLYEQAQQSPRLYLLLLGGVYLGKSLLALWANYASFSVALRMTDDWRMRLIRGYLHVPLRRLDRAQGSMLQIVIDEPSAVGLGLGAAGLLAQNALSALSIYGALLMLSPLLTFGLTVIAGLAMVTIALVSRYTRRIAVRRSEAYNEGYGYLTEMLGAIKQLRVFNIEADAERRAGAQLARMRELQRKSNVIASSPRLLIEIVFLVGLALVLVAIMPRMGDGSVLAAVGLAIGAAMRLLPSLSASAGTWVQLQQAWPAMVRISAELARLERMSPERASDTGAPATFQNRVEVREAHFAYPGREQALAGIDLEIPRGAFVGIVGPSGSGKSTLVDLLCGFYAPDRGAILVDGVDLRTIALSGWRRQLGVVAQDNFLFSGTIRDNLCLMRPDCPEPALREVVRLVGAEEFISALPDGDRTRVGERGLTLSGGQRQRLALARVLLKEPRLLIMDEATSALDVASEEALQEGLERLRGHLTMVVIAHRLSTVRRADRIYVLDRGRVMESGRHDELILQDGLYAAMQRSAQAGVAR